MKLEEWHVVESEYQDGKTHRYTYYGDIDEIEENAVIIPREKWTTEDCINITEGLLEDVNAHKYCNKISDIIQTLRDIPVDENIVLDFAQKYMQHMFELYGY